MPSLIKLLKIVIILTAIFKFQLIWGNTYLGRYTRRSQGRKYFSVFDRFSLAELSNNLRSFLLDSKLLVAAVFDSDMFGLQFCSVTFLMVFSFSQTNYLPRVSFIILLPKVFKTLFVLFRHALPHAFHESQDLLDGPIWMLLLYHYSLLKTCNNKLVVKLTCWLKKRKEEIGRLGMSTDILEWCCIGRSLVCSFCFSKVFLTNGSI